jgi:hypothetical protein
MAQSDLPLLNVFEVELEGVHRHLVCFLDVVLAGAVGIEAQSVVGQFEPGETGDFDPETFELNPGFVEIFVQYMNEVTATTAEIVQDASELTSAWLYLLDPRFPGDDGQEPTASDVLGCFAVDDSGQVVPGSFQYNRDHLWFDPVHGVSGVLADRAFYDWLHPLPPRRESEGT